MAIEIKVPNIGDFSGVEVIEVLIKNGDPVSAEDALITIESDKASMDIPSPAGGKIVEVLLKSGDKVSAGDAIATLEPGAPALPSSSGSWGSSASGTWPEGSTRGRRRSIPP